MRGVHLFMFIVLIPAIAALGHDIYLYASSGELNALPDAITSGERPVDSFFATLGWIWTHYDPASYKNTVQTLEPEQWSLINTILGYKAVVIGLVFAAFWWLLLGVFKILGVWPFRKEKVETGRLGRKQKGPMKYKRK